VNTYLQFRNFTFIGALVLLSACSLIKSKGNILPPLPPTVQPTGNLVTVSFYGSGDGFHGKKTASGEVFDATKLTAAHRTLAFGTNVKLTNPENGRSIVVRINDRGPHVRGRDLDVSAQVAKELGIKSDGIARLDMTIESSGPQAAKEKK
jgi:rare lipoprotein A